MKRAGMFLGFTFCITWLLAFMIMMNGGLENQWAQLVFTVSLMLPGGLTFVVRGITREGFKEPLLWPAFKKNWKYMLLAWVGTLALVALGFGAYFLVFPGQFDWQMTKAVEAYMQVYGEKGYTEETVRQALYVQAASVLVMPIFVNGPVCFCEELGFRGYLQTKLEETYGTVRSVLFSGIIWGIWYSPWVIMGYNYGTGYPLYPVLGCLAMILYCTAAGCLLSWLKIRSNSIWPGAIASTMLTSSSTIYVYFINTDQYNLFLGPCPTGLLGGLGILLAAALCLSLLIRKR